MRQKFPVLAFLECVVEASLVISCLPGAEIENVFKKNNNKVVVLIEKTVM